MHESVGTESDTSIALFHVTSRSNRASIEHHGLDWRRMDATRGIAGSERPEVQGIFLARDQSEVEFFCDMAEARLVPVDVWEVKLELVVPDLWKIPPNPPFGEKHGYLFYTKPIPASRLCLRRPAG